MGVVKYRELLKRHSVLFENFTYISILQIFVMLAPLITYPYLVRVLGSDLYGWVITHKLLPVIVLYLSILVLSGVSARHISVFRDNKEKLSEIMSTILTLQAILWLFCLGIYIIVIGLIPGLSVCFLAFCFSFGTYF